MEFKNIKVLNLVYLIYTCYQMRYVIKLIPWNLSC